MNGTWSSRRTGNVVPYVMTTGPAGRIPALLAGETGRRRSISPGRNGGKIMTVKISSFEIENVKRVKAISMQPTETGLTIIGGGNGQGKTSVLDAISWALGGEKKRPSNPTRTGSAVPGHIHIELSNGLIVERKGENGNLKVFDPAGQKGGQQLLNKFISQLALDLPKFIQSSNKDKADTLLQIIGVSDQLAVLEKKELQYFTQRTEIGRIGKQKRSHAEDMPHYDDVPDEPVSASVLIKQQQAILARNGENQLKRDHKREIEKYIDSLNKEIKELDERHKMLSDELARAMIDMADAEKTVSALQDESTTELEQSISNIDSINVKVRANAERKRVEKEADDLADQYKELTQAIEDTRNAKTALLNTAKLPLPGLSVQDGELIYDGQKWDCMSSSEQLKVATAIVRCINPGCGFVLLDKLEQMDTQTLSEFGQWLEREGLQVIATRVSTGDECSIIIEDGYVKGTNAPPEPVKAWKAGEF